MPSIYIFGATGYLGSHFLEVYRQRGWVIYDQRVDVRDYQAISDALRYTRPDVVLNAAGITGKPNVDWCELHRQETMEVNVSGALNIAYACEKQGLYMVHVGSGCVYEGTNGGHGFTEFDEPNYIDSFYSRTKMLSEKLLTEFHPLQLRIRIPIEGKSTPKNVIDKLVKYKTIISVENSFTIVEDLIPASMHLIERRERGIFNMTNSGSMDHEYLMRNYQKIVDPSYQFSRISMEELSKKVIAGRSNTVLNTQKRESFGAVMPSIKERIITILHQYKQNKAVSKENTAFSTV